MTIATPGAPVSISPDSLAIHAADVLNESVINKAGTLVAHDELTDRSVVRIPYFDTVDALDFTAEAEEIEESGTGLSELVVPSRKLATVRSASNEALRSGVRADLSTKLSVHIIESLTASADAHVFGAHNEDGLTGFGALDGVTETELGNTLDAFTDAFLNVIALGGTEDDISIVAHPEVWRAVTRLKDSSASHRPLLDTVSGSTVVPLPSGAQTAEGLAIDPPRMGPTETTTRTVYGRPVWLSRHIDTAGIYVMDRRNVVVGAEPLRIDQSEHALFRRDSTDFRGTLRVGWKVFRPDRITRITVDGAPGDED